MASLILSNQNDPENIKLLRASNVAYTKAKSWELKFGYSLIFLAFAYPIIYVFIKDESIKLELFGFSFFLTVLIQIITGKIKGNTSKGAIFKEEFDTKIFNLPWKSTLKMPDHGEVSKLSLQYKGKEIKDWYSINLLPTIPHNTAIAILQHSNTSWDIELRKSFKDWIIGILASYSILLFLFFVIMKVDGLTIFLIAFSILSFYTHFISLIRGHSTAIEKREFISKHLDEMIRSKLNINIENLRDIQDEIYSTRQESAKVPNFFFRIYQKRMNAIAEDYIESVNKIYLTQKNEKV
jgi:hypothetical protein